MKVFRTLKRMSCFCAMICSLLAGMIICPMQVWADETPEYRIQVSPVSLDLDLQPGKTTTSKFIVQNSGTKAFDFELSVSPYTVSGENYDQDFSTETNHTNIVNWISFSEDRGTLESYSQREITVTVNVPKDVPEGGQYAVIFAHMIEPVPEGATGVVAEKRVGVLVYSKNVDGETRVGGKITNAKVPSFLFNPPITASAVVENTGNVHANAQYTLQVYPLIGDEEVYTNEEHPDTRVIMPGTSRFNSISWDGAPHLGIFRVKQTVKFADQESVVEKVVFLCPIWFLVIVLVVIFLAVFLIISRIRGKKE